MTMSTPTLLRQASPLADPSRQVVCREPLPRKTYPLFEQVLGEHNPFPLTACGMDFLGVPNVENGSDMLSVLEYEAHMQVHSEHRLSPPPRHNRNMPTPPSGHRLQRSRRFAESGRLLPLRSPRPLR
ncbi:MAG: hypothetical protein AB7U20_14965 [Planctomycetaceae bacterium]